MTVGERIKEARERVGMTQTDLADHINISKQTLYKYEYNIITNIPSDKVFAISEVLNVSPAYLMGWDTDESYKKAQRDIEIIRLFDSLTSANQKTIVDFQSRFGYPMGSAWGQILKHIEVLIISP